MTSNRICLGLILIGIMVALILFPSVVSAQQVPAHDMDDALLLMISAQSRIHENYAPTSSIRLPGLAVPLHTNLSQGASPAEINEQQRLAEAYSDLSRSITSNAVIRQHLENKADYHTDQAQKLARQRRAFQRNRNNIFKRFQRAVATPLVKGSSWAFRGVGKLGRLVVVVAKEEVIFRAKDIIRAKVQDLVDIGRGKLDTVLGRIARKFGLPAAELLREFVITPAFNRLQAQLQRNVDRLTGEKSAQEQNTSTDPGSTDDEYNPDFSKVNEQGDTDYDDSETPTPYPTDDPSDLDEFLLPEENEGRVYDVYSWFSASSCSRFNGNLPSWMVNTAQSAAPMSEMQVLSCHWNSDLRDSAFGCDADGERCPSLPGRVTVDIYALPTISDAQARFRNYTTTCSQDSTCQAGLTELLWHYSEAEPAYEEGIAYFTRMIALNDNVIIELWWGGAERTSDIYGLFGTAQALIDPLQK